MTGDQQDDVTCSKGTLKGSFWNQHFSGMINPSVKNTTVGSTGKKDQGETPPPQIKSVSSRMTDW